MPFRRGGVERRHGGRGSVGRQDGGPFRRIAPARWLGLRFGRQRLQRDAKHLASARLDPDRLRMCPKSPLAHRQCVRALLKPDLRRLGVAGRRDRDLAVVDHHLGVLRLDLQHQRALRCSNPENHAGEDDQDGEGADDQGDGSPPLAPRLRARGGGLERGRRAFEPLGFGLTLVQVGDHLAHRRVTLGRRLGHHLLEEAVQLFGYVGSLGSQRGDRALVMGLDDLVGRLARVRRTPGQQVVKRASQPVDVGPSVDRVGVGGLLRGHVLDRAHGLAGTRHLFAGRLGGPEPGEPQVENLQLPLLIHDQVRRLDVPVNQLVLMGVLKPHGRLVHQLAGLDNRQRALAAYKPRQVFPLDVFQHQEASALDFPSVQGADDVGMVEPADGLHLPLEPGDRPLASQPARRQDLEGHFPAQLRVEGLVDCSHPALGQLFQDLVLA